MTATKSPLQPPPRERLARLPETEAPRLVVVIDTEEEFDWSAPFDRANRSVTHMDSIERLQRVFDEYGVRPIYVIDHPIATTRASAGVLRAIHDDGRCEIGAHLHPWVSPPFEEQVSARNSYPGNLPRELERAKLAELAGAIESNLDITPRAYKAGRYGFGPNTAATLEELGFEVDLSPCPPFDLGADGGPDWSSFPCEPFWISERSRILSVPVTGAYVGFVKDGMHGLYRFSQSLAWARVPGILSRIGALERLMLSPEGYEPAHHRRLVRTLLSRGVRTFTFSLHSPSIVPGHTPYVRSERDLERFLDSCRQFFDFFLRESSGVNRTPSELRAELLPH